MLYHYRLFDLSVSSEIELPELAPRSASKQFQFIAEIQIIMSSGRAENLSKSLTTQLCVLPVKGVATYQIEEGKRITIYPHPQAQIDDIRLFLLGSSLGLLLFQRQWLPIHGNAVKLRNDLLICVGPSGAGKSTLAAAFMLSGYPIFADDVVAVNNENLALPGLPRIKLWEEAADSLGIQTIGLTPISRRWGKFHLPLPTDCLTQSPVSIGYVVELSIDDNLSDGEIRIDKLDPPEAIRMLITNTYRKEWLTSELAGTWHLRRCVALVQSTKIFRLRRAKNHCEPQKLVQYLRNFFYEK